jgi:DNA modification methylase
MVLDPFCGAGTTGLVAPELGRSLIGVELYRENIAQTRGRLSSLTAR